MGPPTVYRKRGSVDVAADGSALAGSGVEAESANPTRSRARSGVIMVMGVRAT